MNRSSSIHCFLQTPNNIHHYRPQAEDILSDEDLLDLFRIIKQIIRKKPDSERIAKLYFCITYAMGDLYQFYKPIHSDVLIFKDESNVSIGPIFAEVQLPPSATCCQNVLPEDPLLTTSTTRAITASPAQAAALTPTTPNGTINNTKSVTTKWNNHHYYYNHHHHSSTVAAAVASSANAGVSTPNHPNLSSQPSAAAAANSAVPASAVAVPQRILSVSYLTNPSPQHKASPQVSDSQLLSREHRESAAQAAAAAALATPTATPTPTAVDVDETATDQYTVRPYTNLRSAYPVHHQPSASSLSWSSSSATPLEEPGSPPPPQPSHASMPPQTSSQQQQQQQQHALYHQHPHHFQSSTFSYQSQQQQQQRLSSSSASINGGSAPPPPPPPSSVSSSHDIHHSTPLTTPSSGSTSSMVFGSITANSITTTTEASSPTMGNSFPSSNTTAVSSTHMSTAATMTANTVTTGQQSSFVSNHSNSSSSTTGNSYTTLSRYPHLNTLIHGNGTNTEVLMEPKQRGFYYQDGRITREPALLQRYAEQGVLTQASLMRKRKKIFGQLDQDYPSSYVEALSTPAPAKKPKIPHRHGEFRQRRDDIISRMRTILISDLEQKAQRLPESFTLSIEKATLSPNVVYSNLSTEEAGKLLAPALRILCYHSNMKPHLDNGMNQNGIYYNNDYFRLYLAFVQFQEIFATLFPNEVVRITSFLDDIINNNNNSNNSSNSNSNATSPSADNQLSSNSSQMERDKDRERNANMKAYRGWIEPFLAETNWAAFRRNIMVGERIMQLTKVVGQGVLLMTKELSGSKLHLTFTNNEWEEFIQGLSQGLWDDTIDWSHDDDAYIYNDEQHAYRKKKDHINGGSLLVNELKMKFATHFWFTEDGKLVPPAERKRLRALERQQNNNNGNSNNASSNNNDNNNNNSSSTGNNNGNSSNSSSNSIDNSSNSSLTSNNNDASNHSNYNNNNNTSNIDHHVNNNDYDNNV
ncbi:hypothetical protein BDF20DRAFT_839744 [Mycotypha africana]|uniref:uncharacterized protein n=1 Tax=Mycotypha africana TaxID=64632 RepID=UPI0022FFE68D|nr:uncharacterized protein BDF20DRAFT_839744 [Mycotypha africana]KAI8967906.1 hypothetical protein BDF20DRAFT_839744 [Mycotypha africana]